MLLSSGRFQRTIASRDESVKLHSPTSLPTLPPLSPHSCLAFPSLPPSPLRRFVEEMAVEMMLVQSDVMIGWIMDLMMMMMMMMMMMLPVMTAWRTAVLIRETARQERRLRR